ncbi:tRNA threonylcarbamoyladenosine dehydratase [Aureibacter tunicatorum]|uniref:tRNA A37 threonylcarbamoyladenosine dehydratase n=1 Tax=Aureibacter tunicatorum TaxID=866807 RepID=A0AAE4BVG3_9BACT|nr:tRNA threonylcarbamoyladenosine dehydratase [Aureibacter tunicatorum]MDR6241708.1 tRNA A37 threonylcarbamoyladenosine dehydratase [Aureibacter tunicatorum]BDD07307.1 tRNA threonylcarbamoyladenosine dehydratase [Aureibacter tunicatorum]
METWFERTELLLGEDQVKKLNDANVLVIGLGGVGGICAEMIGRSGVGKMTIIDGDTVARSNRNRQIAALSSTEGKLKSEIMRERLIDINPDLDLTVISEYIEAEEMGNLLDQPFDYVVDCIDTLAPKIVFISEALKRGHNLVSSMGAGGKIDPTQARVANLWDTYNCKLAFFVRKRLRRMGVEEKRFPVVFSPEAIDKSRVYEAEGKNKKSVIGTLSVLPATFGVFCASLVIRGILGEKLI